MPRRSKKLPIKLKLRQEIIYSLGSLMFFALSGLIMLSFKGEGRIFGIVNDLVRTWFGGGALMLPFLVFSAGLTLTHLKWSFAKPHVFLGGTILFLGVISLFSLGESGIFLYETLAQFILPAGASFVSFLTLIAGLMVMSDTGVGEILHMIANIFEIIPGEKERQEKENNATLPLLDQKKTQFEDRKDFKEELKIKVLENTPTPVPESEEPVAPVKKTKGIDPEKKINLLGGIGKNVPSAKQASDQPIKVWTLPPLSLLDAKAGGTANRGDVNRNANTIEKTLDSFGIVAKVVDFKPGPAVTQYCLQLSTGTKIAKITSLANDLALALAAPTGQIRIEAPIPGTTYVGVEIPNISAEFVSLRTMLVSDEMKKQQSKLSVALGLNVAGKPVVLDIGKMPHALIAGATGSGKSVAMNAFIASILFRASPDEVKFIMVDPKRVELTQYNDIPHLLTPVITDNSKVLGTLNWAVNEMNNRYKLFAEVGVRNITAYNEMAGFQSMHYIVIVIDELADIMLLAPAPVEEAITRLAQMARAVGIHLLLATQRPSVNVITGLIKANIPTRIAFNVSSMIDSRVILDTPGAEKLLGRGDMLYIPPDQAKPTRVQGTFVADHEIRKLISFIKDQGVAPSYTQEIAEKFQTEHLPGSAKDIISGGSGDKDEKLVCDAIRVILQHNRASVSVLQRRLSLGYGRAARIMDVLAEEGIVGEDQGSKGREVNVVLAQEYLAKREMQQ